ncbi:MAG TPA: hypothetical protein PKN06_03665 [Chitinophagaceae bacterium]|nr:hypothetical protein [Chitinophagaceae bacterium]
MQKNFFLRMTLVATFFAAFQFTLLAQPGSVPDQTTGSAELNINDLPLRSVNIPALTDVGGSIYLSTDFIPATIRLKDGGVVKNIPVRFNIYNNAVMVRKDGSEQKIDPFEEITYNVYTNSGEANTFVFRQGYPDIENHSASSVYQVVADGAKVQVLKYLSQKVEDAPTLGDYSRRELVKSQQLYIYTPDGEIKKIILGKKAMSSFPAALTAQAEEIVKVKSLNLKNESDLVVLAQELNK